MPRDLTIGNGSLLVAFDSQYRLADFYFPHVGMENHAATRFRFGVWADDMLSWVDDVPWQHSLNYLRDTLVTDVLCQNDAIGIRLRCYDAVDPDHDVVVRKVVVRNLREEARDIKLFVHHDFNLYGNAIGDTAYFDPESRALVHYKTRRYVMVSAEDGIAEYACGRDGTWRDAEDGELSMSPIAQGSVDATFAIPLRLDGHGTATTMYWICAGRRYGDVCALDRKVREEGAAKVLARTGSYWYTWVNKPEEDLADLPDEVTDLYRRSLLVIATQCDRDGAILAANDSDIAWGHNDHYSYMWTRDAAFVCDAMDRAGFPEITRRFLEFANDVIKEDGYFLHKYNPDGSLASLWHPWVRAGKAQLPIQEDETALVIWLIARHYRRTRDLELLRKVYRKLVVQPADFLTRFRDAETGLPLPSFDLWEERQGVFTFTCAAVWAGLTAAAEIAKLFNDQERRAVWLEAADRMRTATMERLWIESEQRFARGLVLRDDDTLELDPTVDASAFAVFHFGMFPAASAPVEGTMRAIRERLAVQTDAGGIARYERDSYHQISEDTERIPGNPWIICTLWLAEHIVATARRVPELEGALDLVRWARSKASSSLILPEQINPYDGQPLSVAPLTWSHAQVVSVVRGYLDARRATRRNDDDRDMENDAEFGGLDAVDNPQPLP
jgi:glucoamylase